MQKLYLVLIATISFTFSQAQTKSAGMVLARIDTMHFEKDSVFSFAIDPSLRKSGLVWKTRDEIILTQFARAFKSRCEVEKISCIIVAYPPVCDRSGAARWNISNNIASYLVKKAGIPQKYISTSMSSDGGPATVEYKGKAVPYIEIVLTAAVL